VLSQSPATAVELTTPIIGEPLLPRRSTVDIFAPVGATPASGVPISQIGRAIDPATLVQLAIPECTQTSPPVLAVHPVC